LYRSSVTSPEELFGTVKSGFRDACKEKEAARRPPPLPRLRA
jgi:hypothetical protein